MTEQPSTAARPDPEAPVKWHQRSGVLLTVAVVVIVAIAVVSDLPTAASRSTQIADANAFIHEVNADLEPCDYALHQAFELRVDQLNGALTASDGAQVPALLRDDEMACSYAGPQVTDLTNIENPGTAASRPLEGMLATALQWATYDALSAIDDIQGLLGHPKSADDERALAHDTLRLQEDRFFARESIVQADQILHARLAQVDLSAATDPSS